MSSKLFFYKREFIKQPTKEGEEKESIWYEDSFNPDYVIRSMSFQDGVVVLLDDGHEKTEEEPVKNKKGQVEWQRKRNWNQSELFIKDKEDIDRFKRLLSID